MDLRVELADGSATTFSVSSGCTPRDAVKTIAQHSGLDSMLDKLSEFSLARKDAHSAAWIDVSWLSPDTPLAQQRLNGPSSPLLFRKKYFSKNHDLQNIDSSDTLLGAIYSQLLHSFTAGLYKCSTFQAAQIAALAALVEFPVTDLTPAALMQDGRLQRILPGRLSNTAGINQIILRGALKNAGRLSKTAAQKAFIQRLQKLETFGLAFYSMSNLEVSGTLFRTGYEGLLGVGGESIFVVDREAMEVLDLWEIADLSSFRVDGSKFTLVFDQEQVTMVARHSNMIYSYLSGIKQVGEGILGEEPASPVSTKETDVNATPPAVSNGEPSSNSFVASRRNVFRQRSFSDKTSMGINHMNKNAPPRIPRKPLLPPLPTNRSEEGTGLSTVGPRGVSPRNGRGEKGEGPRKLPRPRLPPKPSSIPFSLGNVPKKPLSAVHSLPMPPTDNGHSDTHPEGEKGPRRRPNPSRLKPTLPPKPPAPVNKPLTPGGGGAVELLTQRGMMGRPRIDSCPTAPPPPVPTKRQSFHKSPSPPPRPPARPPRKSSTDDFNHTPTSPEEKPELPPRPSRRAAESEASDYIDPVVLRSQLWQVQVDKPEPEYETVEYPADEETRKWRSQSFSPEPSPSQEFRQSGYYTEDLSAARVQRKQSSDFIPIPAPRRRSYLSRDQTVGAEKGQTSLMAAELDQGEDGGVEIYSTVRDDAEEVSQILTGSADLSTEVQFAHKVNPVYNTRTASETQTLLRNSDVTFKSLNQSFKRNRIQWTDDNPPTPAPPAPPSKERQNPLQALVKAVSRRLSQQPDSDAPTPGKGKERPQSPNQRDHTRLGRKLPLLPPKSKAKQLSKSASSGELVNSEPGLGPRIARLGVVKDNLSKSIDMYGEEDAPRHNHPPPSSSVAKQLPRAPRTGITKLGVVKMDESEQSKVYGQMGVSSRPSRDLRPLPVVPPPDPTDVEYILPQSDEDTIEVDILEYSEVFGKIRWSPPLSLQSPPTADVEITRALDKSRVESHDYEDIDVETDEVAVGPKVAPSPPTKRNSAIFRNGQSSGLSPDDKDANSEETTPAPLPSARARGGVRGRIHSDSMVYQDPSPMGDKGAKKGPRRKVVPPPPKPPRAHRKNKDGEEPDGAKQQPRLMRPGEILKDYSTLLREFRVFFVKLPIGVVHVELASLTTPLHKLITRLCILLFVEDPGQYSLFLEGAALTSLEEKQQLEVTSDEEQPEGQKSKRKGRALVIEEYKFLSSHTVLPDQGPAPILLNPDLSFLDHGITTTRILALRLKESCANRAPAVTEIRIPDWVRFHLCWLNVVQGSQPCSVHDAVKLAALQYQAYFLDRTEINSVIGFCKSHDFLPKEYAPLRAIEEKVLQEQKSLKGYSRRKAQECYIHASCSLATYGAVFFPCKELKKRALLHKKLTPILIGINGDGVMRVDPKTKEVLDMWPYEGLQNWGFGRMTFVLDFIDSSYPLQTNQGRWMNSLIDFHVENIIKHEPAPISTEVMVGRRPSATSRGQPGDDQNQDSAMDEIYDDILLAPSQHPASPSSPSSPHTYQRLRHYHMLEPPGNTGYSLAGPTADGEQLYQLLDSTAPPASDQTPHSPQATPHSPQAEYSLAGPSKEDDGYRRLESIVIHSRPGPSPSDDDENIYEVPSDGQSACVHSQEEEEEEAVYDVPE